MSLSSPADVNIRLFEVRDAPSVTRIWVNGLEQTVQAASVFTRPLWRWLMATLANHAISIDGDMGPDGANLHRFWGSNGDKEREDRAMFIAESRDGITGAVIVVGVCCVKRGEDEKVIPQAGYPVFSIWRMSVDERFRGFKIGTRLMCTAEEWARSKGGKRITLITGNSIASKFYQSIGYKTINFWKIRHEKELSALEIIN